MSAEKPNIVLLFADDLGRYASAYADPAQPSPNDIVKTPVFDRIAAISRASFAALGWIKSGFMLPLIARKACGIPPWSHQQRLQSPSPQTADQPLHRQPSSGCHQGSQAEKRPIPPAQA
jgi:hypothetical protein